MEKSVFKAIVNENLKYSIDEQTLEELDIFPLADDRFHVLHNDQSLKVTLLNADFPKKEITLSINGELFTVKIEDRMDVLVKKMGLKRELVHMVKEIKAPMPGLVLDVMVEEGQSISKGEGLLILEAMKMENVIKAAGDGIVKSINIEKGMAVDKGKILIEME